MRINEFLDSISGLSEATLNAYKSTLWLFYNFIKDEEPTAEEAQKFLRRYKPTSLFRHKAAIRSYFEWAFGKDSWPFDRRSFRQPRQSLPRWIPAEKVHEMAVLAEDPDDRMFVETLFMSGARISELRAVTAEDLRGIGIAVLQKGGDESVIPLTDDFYTKLAAYAQGKRGNLFPKTYDYYSRLLKRLGKQVGHPEVTPHMLRHSRAVDLLDRGLDLAYVAQFLRHHDLNTVYKYLQITGGPLRKKIEEASKAIA